MPNNNSSNMGEQILNQFFKKHIHFAYIFICFAPKKNRSVETIRFLSMLAQFLSICNSSIIFCILLILTSCSYPRLFRCFFFFFSLFVLQTERNQISSVFIFQINAICMRWKQLINLFF